MFCHREISQFEKLVSESTKIAVFCSQQERKARSERSAFKEPTHPSRREFRKKEKKFSSNIVAKLVKNQHTQAKRRLSRAKGGK